MTPAVSVLIPVYNAAVYLPQCLESILKQQLKSIEIICIDDGSSDGSFELLQKYAETDGRLRVFSQPNQGVAVTRNRLLEKARGKYIAFVDADDFVFPDYLVKLYHAAQHSSAEVVKSFFYEVESDGPPRKKAHCRGSFYQVPPPDESARFRAGYEDGVLWGKLFRLSWIRRHNFCFWPGNIAEDFPFVILAFLYASKIAVVRERLYCYRKGVTTAVTADSYRMAVGILTNLMKLRKELMKRRKWNQNIVQEWICSTVWGVSRFRKFPPDMRRKQTQLIDHAWQTVQEEIPFCSWKQRARWKSMMFLTRFCGRKSVYFWSKIFR